MRKIDVKTSSRIIPMIYAYSTPDVPRHDGWVKIGYTERQDVSTRIRQQLHTADVDYVEEWKGNAIFEDGSGERFDDKDFHKYLRKNGVYYDEAKRNEWFHIDGVNSYRMFNEFRQNHGILEKLKEELKPYTLRDEQNEAVKDTLLYSIKNSYGSEFLWNCKPRFGKTLSAYDLMKKMGCINTLIVTNRPAIANSWYDDYVQFVGDENCYYFVSENREVKDNKYVLNYEEFEKKKKKHQESDARRIEFNSLQDIKGSIYFGGDFDKLKHIKDTKWDLLIIDETHEGVDTYKTDVALDAIERKFTLHLSGTPFKALASNKFSEDAIYNWTYADEQRKKLNWDSEDRNPYEDMPKLNLFTYKMSEIIKEEVSEGIEIGDNVEEYAFDLNEFFKTNESEKFIHEDSVDKFLDALTSQLKFPFSTQDLRYELKHTFWLLDRVASCKALEKKLKNHPVFKDYQIIVAAGYGNENNENNGKSLENVKQAIKKYDKTITLSVGQLTTGVTVPEWTAVLMLCNVKSPALYMQAAFRAQNPCVFKNENGEFLRKENAYVFDFDPARTLIIFEEFANGLSKNPRKNYATSLEPKNNVKELLNFFPVYGEDEEGEMIELDCEKVLSIPRKIKSVEVVKRGFMSNFLFQNISNIFVAPKELLDIIEQFDPISESKVNAGNIDIPDDILVDENGEVIIENETVIGTATELFGEKIYSPVKEIIDIVEDVDVSKENPLNIIKKTITDVALGSIKSTLAEYYNDKGVKKSDLNKIQTNTVSKIETTINRLNSEIKIKKNTLEKEYQEIIQNSDDDNIDLIKKEFESKVEELNKVNSELIKKAIKVISDECVEDSVRIVEKSINERKANTVEDKIKDHLRGFSRTIPAFLMAYGDENTTIENFDQIIPDEVFKEVTSISLEEFRKLRDGGTFIQDGQEKSYSGLFNPTVFNDSIKEFLNKKKELSNYFDEEVGEDIFDYIPPQKTNQIFTPKKIVKQMVDYLEKENPGCFDNPNYTFIDPYMKSGLYIAEIVKRLFNSETIKQLYPDDNQRLKHIFEKQVYGLAPTEIIYRIAKSFVLGFDSDNNINSDNLVKLDAVPYAKEGKLAEKLDEIFRDK